MKPVVDITWFSWQLWRLTGRRGMTFLYLYSFMGFACLKLVTPDFGLLAKVEYALEGAFRYIEGFLLCIWQCCCCCIAVGASQAQVCCCIALFGSCIIALVWRELLFGRLLILLC